MKANFVWDLPDLHERAAGAAGDRPGRQRLAALRHLDGVDRQRLHRRLQLPERRRQREPDRLARLRRARPHRRRSRAAAAAAISTGSSTPAAFQGPLVGSVGLESGNDYLRGCFTSVLDLSIARNIRLGGGREHPAARRHVQRAQRRRGITGRNTTMNLSNPNDPVTITEPAVRRERQPDRRAVAAARRRVRRREQLPGARAGAGADPLLVLRNLFSVASGFSRKAA